MHHAADQPGPLLKSREALTAADHRVPSAAGRHGCRTVGHLDHQGVRGVRGLRDWRGWWWAAAFALVLTSIGGGINGAVPAMNSSSRSFGAGFFFCSRSAM